MRCISFINRQISRLFRSLIAKAAGHLKKQKIHAKFFISEIANPFPKEIRRPNENTAAVRLFYSILDNSRKIPLRPVH